jgi:ribosomal protein S18 acetylase RimI-like enzyme
MDIRTSEEPDSEWLAVYRQGEGGLPAVAERLLVNADQPLFASAPSSGSPGDQTVAIGRCVVTGSWAGLTAIEVRPEFRRQGLATNVVADLLDHARQRGVRHVYVQVAQDNSPALALYARLGFELHHEYSYLRLSP